MFRFLSSAFVILPRRSPSRLFAISFDQENKIINLPPRENLNELEQEFRDKIAVFASFSEEQIASVPNPRLRALYEGVAASAHDPAVYRAFEVLFEDLLPLRIAGRLIFGRLATKMEEQRTRRDHIMEMTTLSREETDQCRSMMDRITGSDHQYLSLAQVRAVAKAIEETLEERVELPSHRLSQDAVLLLLSEKTSQPSAILRNVNPEVFKKKNAKKCKFEEQYDYMVQSFSQWQEIMPEGEGRRMDVLKGCFVGAKNEKVLEALKIVYVDYAALRLAGDLIFQLVSALVQNRSNRDPL
jgi:hypothetical protein